MAKKQKTYSGQFNLRIDPVLHGELVALAGMELSSLNRICYVALKEWAAKKKHKIEHGQ